MSRSALSLFALLTTACSGSAPEQLPPQGQVLLYFTTNAPLPAAQGVAASPDTPPPLFDRLLLDVYEAGTDVPCSSCSRDYELDTEAVKEDRVSIGILPTPGREGHVVRARLFRGMSKQGTDPPTPSTVDVFTAVPIVAAEGLVEATVVLDVEDVGRPKGSLDAPISSRPGKPTPADRATWPRAARIPCLEEPAPGEACVPGGAYWMGHPQAPDLDDGADAGDPRLVTLAPFYVDLTEVTVGAFRASGLARLEEGVSVNPTPGPSPGEPIDTADDRSFCTYHTTPITGADSREHLPVNCVTWELASAFCASQGKMLPSEAEFEYLASGLRSRKYLWGEDPPSCTDAVWGRHQTGADQCVPPGSIGGALPPGSGERDRLDLDGRVVVDLVGNLNEWTRDFWNRLSEPCWADRPLLDNPQCAVPSVGQPELRTVKGFNFVGAVSPVAVRIGRSAAAQAMQRGFRCVRPAR